MGSSGEGMAAALATLAGAPVDVIIDFGSQPAREVGVTLLRALFGTVPVPWRQANRFGPLWGTRHFVIQGLWVLRHASLEGLANPDRQGVPAPAVECVPTVAQFGRWMLGEIGSRAIPLLRRGDRPLRWRIAIRRTHVPLYEDASRPALGSFRWIDSPTGCQWTDLVICERDGETWLFFEELVDPSRVGHICCGRLTTDGDLVEVRSVLLQPHHLSFPADHHGGPRGLHVAGERPGRGSRSLPRDPLPRHLDVRGACSISAVRFDRYSRPRGRGG
jgi:hypothetical protein